MSQTLRVSFNSPQSGWMSMSLEAGEQSFLAAVSCAPYDSLHDLIEGLIALLTGDEEMNIRWNCEPDEFDLKISVMDRTIELRVIHYNDHRRHTETSSEAFSFQGSKLEVCSAFWLALRDLHRDIVTDEFERNWRRPFPGQKMQRLTEALSSFKRKSARLSSRP